MGMHQCRYDPGDSRGPVTFALPFFSCSEKFHRNKEVMKREHNFSARINDLKEFHGNWLEIVDKLNIANPKYKHFVLS